MAEPIAPQSFENPYVGPRTFTRAERSRYFGREREARDLLSLVISQRLILFYAQSGAGKSSLVNTRLVPQLMDEGFLVLPVGRVGGDLPDGIERVDNIYAFNLMLGLDQGTGNPERFSSLDLTQFLNLLTSEDGEHWYFDEDAASDQNELSEPELSAEADGELESDLVTQPYVLIIDQFEEIVTTHPTHWSERELFFQQLEAAMQADPSLWVVLVLREDFVAALDPYAHIMTDKLRARFYMERMGVAAALEAIKRPAEIGGRPFADGVAEQLVDNLRQIQGHTPEPRREAFEGVEEGSQAERESLVPAMDGATAILGQYLEPVQLQVVCYQLWENIRSLPAAPISRQNLEDAGNVDTALAAFYEDAIHSVLNHSYVSVNERVLRSWFADELITDADTRGTVYQGTYETAGMPNQVVRLLSNQFLLRTELRAGGAWVELVHDRFVDPILRSNQSWLERQSPLIRAAQQWSETDQDPALLMTSQQLDALAEDVNSGQTDPLVADYVRASRIAIRQQAASERAKQREAELEQARALAQETEARRRAESERAAEAEARQREQAAAATKLRRRFIFITILGGLAVVFAGIAAFSAFGALSQRDMAEQEQATAQAASTLAVAESTRAAQERDKANISSETAEAERIIAAEAQLKAEEARQTAVAQSQIAATESAAASAAREQALTLLNDRLTADARALAEATETPQPQVNSTTSTELATAVSYNAEAEPTATPTITPDSAATTQALVAQQETLEAQQIAAEATQIAVATTAVAAEAEATATADASTKNPPAATDQVSLTADPPIIAPGDCTTLLWQTRNVKEVYLQDQGKAGVGLSTECPERTTTYRLRVVFQDDTVIERETTVTVDANTALQSTLPSDATIRSTLPSVKAGECVYVIWQTRNVNEVFYQGEGVAGNDLRRECPSERTQYTLRAIYVDGTEVEQFTIVNVQP